MEVKKEHILEPYGSFEGIDHEAATTPWTVKDAIIVPQRKSCSKISSVAQDDKDEAGISRMKSFDKNLESPVGKKIRKAKSLSAQFLVNIDELINNVPGSYDQTCSVLSRASSNGLGYSFPLAGATMPSENFPDVLRLQSPNCNQDGENGQSEPDHEDEPDSLRWKQINSEPVLPIYIKFQDVKYKVSVKGVKRSGSEKYILHGITGSINPGEVLALMGPSGGGKTSLLSLLSGRVKFSSGTITYNDQPYTKSLKTRIGFVLQDDVVFPHLTVKETLTYAALLRLSSTLTREQKKERAMNVISELGLERCQDTLIGGKFVRGISGGERKRVCIGNEILLNPSLLFLDEPTSGLDSTTALRIGQILNNIAKAGKAVVTTIHQPSSRLFHKFDRLILLSRGSSLYFGKASEAMMYFSSIGCNPLIAMNPSEFLIDLASGNIKDKSVPSELEDKFLQGSKRFEKKNGGPSSVDVQEFLVEAYEVRLAKIEERKLQKPVIIQSEPDIEGRSNSREWGATWWEQFSILFSRGLKERRHEYLSCMRVTQVISTAVIIGLLWWHSDASTPKRLQDQAGLLFFVSVFWGFFPLFNAIFTFPQERAMLAKERSVGMYKLSAYFLGRTTSDLPLDLLLPIVFLLIVYFMVGLKLNFASFSLTMLTVFLSVVAAQGLGLTIGAAFMDVKKATTVASIIVMAFMLSAGFFIQKVPLFMVWVRYISFNYHTYRLLLKIQYGCPAPTSGSSSCESPFIRGLRLGEGETEVGALMAMVVVYRLLAYLLLRRITKT
ncbi:ABC transporter G family member 22-like isoform X1 [Juglans microcarpa x Juglans regia]|uniref:ABC transporter G family member 22-like isoform X1 n=1 Tax=Juglans microcarpa x Juglans regia TaxID=2249226 RepID=UPI001B7EE84A|nr:ABC transporter G family member 22-like isoform X1 [Juglans microcarpa x Juglans regia]XP_040995896.1 ABC transporter G family member 22-like isoform X1 [Juglans microcarpa x Juglans regia]XP_040995897.1 ABC transporter G family member 22-like isoform X1 [Juglans microcarpa x Juglans regia]